VFDPLAISLILAYNNIVVKEMEARGEEIDETKGFNPFQKGEVNTPNVQNPEPEKIEQVESLPEPPVLSSVARLMPTENPPPPSETHLVTPEEVAAVWVPVPPEEPETEEATGEEPPVHMEPNQQPDWIEEPPVVQSVARLVPRELSPPEPTPELEVVEEEDEPEDFVKAVSDSIIETIGNQTVEATDGDDEPPPPPPLPRLSTTNDFPG